MIGGKMGRPVGSKNKTYKDPTKFIGVKVTKEEYLLLKTIHERPSTAVKLLIQAHMAKVVGPAGVAKKAAKKVKR